MDELLDNNRGQCFIHIQYQYETVLILILNRELIDILLNIEY